MTIDEVLKTPFYNMTDEQIEVLLRDTKEEEKNILLRHLIKSLKWRVDFEESLNKLDTEINETIRQLLKNIEVKNGEIEDLFERLDNKNLELLDKESIKNIFKCESDKALKILKQMYASKFGCKVGKEYYITRNEFLKFMNSYKGMNLQI